MVNICINVPEPVIKRWKRNEKWHTIRALCTVQYCAVLWRAQLFIIQRYAVHVYGVWTVDTPRRSSGISDWDSNRIGIRTIQIQFMVCVMTDDNRVCATIEEFCKRRRPLAFILIVWCERRNSWNAAYAIGLGGCLTEILFSWNMHRKHSMNILTTSRRIRQHSINNALISFRIEHRDWDPNDFRWTNWIFTYLLHWVSSISIRERCLLKANWEPANRYCHICSSSCAWFAVLRSFSLW